jgi:hypothetical protein
MPKIADIQETPNPNAVKFILKEPVSHGTQKKLPKAMRLPDRFSMSAMSYRFFIWTKW